MLRFCLYNSVKAPAGRREERKGDLYSPFHRVSSAYVRTRDACLSYYLWALLAAERSWHS